MEPGATIKQFRLDRFVTLFFFRPLQRSKPRKKGVQIPILMYHSISNDPEPGVRPYYKLCTSPRRLQEHMAFLKDAGYQVIPLSLAVGLLCAGEHEAQSTEFLEGKKIRDEAYATGYQSSDLHSDTVLSGSHALPVSGPFVVLTFDDGYRDFYTTAWPILSQFGFTATVFLATAFVGGSFKKRDCLSWSEIRELQGAGVFFGSHTVTHPQLYGLSWQEIELELRESKKALEDHLGAHVEDFSYPYAYPEADKPFCKRLDSKLREFGYKHCLTTSIGLASTGDNLLRLKRLPANSADDLTFLNAKLRGAYNWLAHVQRLLKVLKLKNRRRTEGPALSGS